MHVLVARRRVRERDDGGGSGLAGVDIAAVATPSPTERRDLPGWASRRGADACTTTGLRPGLRRGAGRGGGQRRRSRHAAVPEAPRGTRRRLARAPSRRVRGRPGYRRPPGRSAAAGPNVAPPSVDMAAKARTAPPALACQATVTRPPAATTLGRRRADDAAHERGRRGVADDDARADDARARRAAVVAGGGPGRAAGLRLDLRVRPRVVAERHDDTPVRQHGERRAAVVGRSRRRERRHAARRPGRPEWRLRMSEYASKICELSGAPCSPAQPQSSRVYAT